MKKASPELVKELISRKIILPHNEGWIINPCLAPELTPPKFDLKKIFGLIKGRGLKDPKNPYGCNNYIEYAIPYRAKKESKIEIFLV